MNKSLIRAAAVCAMAALIPACGGGSGAGTGSGSLTRFVDYLTGGPGVHSILTKGGVGMNGLGGIGGSVLISSKAGSDLRVLTTGAIDASFAIPSGTPDLGANPLIVSSAVTITYTGTDGVNTVAQNGMFFGQDGTTYATGLWIQNGGTLTLSPNDGATPATSISIQVICPRGIRIDAGGTIKAAGRGDIPSDGASVRFDCVGFFSAGTVSTRSPDPAGGAAGNLEIYSVWGDLIQRGSVLANGTGTSGAAGGNVDLGFGEVGGLFNTGPVDASGAPSAAATGGAAGNISLVNETPSETGTGPVYNSGNLTARGGAGSLVGNGGPGGEIWIDASFGWGAACNSGTLDSSGGAAGVTGNGGFGKQINVLSWGYFCRCSGTLTSTGGSGGTTSGSGGDAGNITIAQAGASTAGFATGKGNNLGVWCGATLDASGGSARGAGANSPGGAGGQVKIQNALDESIVVPGTSPVVVAGLTGIDSSGGRAALPGFIAGVAGSVTIENLAAKDPNGVLWLGGSRNEVPITARGGDGVSGAGDGGAVLIRSFGDLPNTFPATEFSTVNTADIVTSGGAAQSFAAAGGEIMIFDRSVVSNSGDLTADGGLSVTAIGGNGGAITVRTDTKVFDDGGSVQNSGALSSLGGGGVVGGTGGSVLVYNHFLTTNTGAIFSNGGAATGTGGDGGTILLYSDVDVRNAAALQNSGGAGGTGFGGFGGLVYIVGQSAVHTGNLTSAGGGSTLGVGGNGGILRIEGTITLATVHGTFSVPAGAPGGQTGYVQINGVPVPLTAGSVTY